MSKQTHRSPEEQVFLEQQSRHRNWGVRASVATNREADRDQRLRALISENQRFPTDEIHSLDSNGRALLDLEPFSDNELLQLAASPVPEVAAWVVGIPAIVGNRAHLIPELLATSVAAGLRSHPQQDRYGMTYLTRYSDAVWNVRSLPYLNNLGRRWQRHFFVGDRPGSTEKWEPKHHVWERLATTKQPSLPALIHDSGFLGYCRLALALSFDYEAAVETRYSGTSTNPERWRTVTVEALRHLSEVWETGRGLGLARSTVWQRFSGLLPNGYEQPSPHRLVNWLHESDPNRDTWIPWLRQKLENGVKSNPTAPADFWAHRTPDAGHRNGLCPCDGNGWDLPALTGKVPAGWLYHLCPELGSRLWTQKWGNKTPTPDMNNPALAGMTLDHLGALTT